MNMIANDSLACDIRVGVDPAGILAAEGGALLRDEWLFAQAFQWKDAASALLRSLEDAVCRSSFASLSNLVKILSKSWQIIAKSFQFFASNLAFFSSFFILQNAAKISKTNFAKY